MFGGLAVLKPKAHSTEISSRQDPKTNEFGPKGGIFREGMGCSA